MARDRNFDPRRLDVRAFAAAEGSLSGEVPQAQLERLVAGLMALPGDGVLPSVPWSANGEARQVAAGAPQIWLHLRADTHVTLQCQRCLQPMSEALHIDRAFRFVTDEEEAARLDEDSEDDVLVLPRSFDLHELLEDELILTLPLVPRHETCPEPLAMTAGDDGSGDEAEDKPSPFAALAALRRPPGKD